LRRNKKRGEWRSKNGYYKARNHHNVLSANITTTPIERIVPQGMQCSSRVHVFDLLIYTTGFDGIMAPCDRIEASGLRPAVTCETTGGRGLPAPIWVAGEGAADMLAILGPNGVGKYPEELRANRGLYRAPAPPPA